VHIVGLLSYCNTAVLNLSSAMDPLDTPVKPENPFSEKRI